LSIFLNETLIVAFHFLLTISQGSNFGQRLKKWLGWITAGPAYICAGWMLPFMLATIFLVKDKLGYSPYAASTWCYVVCNHKKGIIDADVVVTVYCLVDGCAWGVFALIVTSICCLATLAISRRLRVSVSLSAEDV